MKLLILSDLHNDIASMPVEVDGRRIDAEADVVVLAGDIHEGVHSPMWAREAFPDKPIILIAGNHEFYGKFWRRNVRKIREKSESLGIHFLENDSVTIDGVCFLGCTLWTDFMLHGEHMRAVSMLEAQRKMNDYRRILLDRKPGDNADFRQFKSAELVPVLTRLRHQESVAWLEQELQSSDPKTLERTVVVTHHAPHPNSIPGEFEGHILSPAYASNLSHLMGYAPLWIHGHIHDRRDYMLGDTRVVANPRGYPHKERGKSKLEYRNENERFDPFFTVEI
jgi:Icc-related predicted phosphoesterase